MRKLTTLLMLGFAMLPLVANAADDFGQRFGGNAPAALGVPEAPVVETVAVTPAAIDSTTAQGLQDIAPAAGAPAQENITEEQNAAPSEETPEILPHKAPASTHDGYERDIENTEN